MSFNEIKRIIHEKYPGKYTDEEIKNILIIIGNDGYYMDHNFNKKILVIEA